MIAMALVVQPRAADRRRADDRARRDDPGPDPRADRQAAGDFGSAVVLITHDLGVVAEIADQVVVMYAGRIVEQGPSARSSRPQHPYTWGLLARSRALDGASRSG